MAAFTLIVGLFLEISLYMIKAYKDDEIKRIMKKSVSKLNPKEQEINKKN